MTVKTISQKNKVLATTALPDLSWYRDAANPKKRAAHIKKLCAQIARDFQVEKIILFGSQAYGHPTIDSDVDLLVVMSHEGSPLLQAGKILKHLRVWMPLDLIVRNAEEIEERLQLGDKFMREILARGKVIYEAKHT